MSEHTPGPWQVSKTLLPPHRIDGIWSEDGIHICSFAHCISIEPEYDVLRSNANLMAAAPRMLAALEANLRDFGLVNEYIALVAKAKQTLSGSDKFKIPAIHPFTHAVKETAAAIQAAKGE